MARTQKEVREALKKHGKIYAYLLSSEHYDVDPKGETKAAWVREAVEYADPYIVGINTGSYTEMKVAVVAGHPDEALETADEWYGTYMYEGDPDAYEEARGAGEGVVSVQELRKGNPKRVVKKRRKKNPTAAERKKIAEEWAKSRSPAEVRKKRAEMAKKAPLPGLRRKKSGKKVSLRSIMAKATK